MILSHYNPAAIEHALRKAEPPAPFPPAAERGAWEKRAQEVGEEEVRAIIAQAEVDAQVPLSILTATLYLDFERTGERYNYQAPQDRRREMVRNLVLAECLEGQGRFLEPILDVAWAICEESSWARPAHEPNLPDMERPFLDLNVAATALELAELDTLLGTQLHPALGRRIRYEINRRCFVPYLGRHDHHWMYTRNAPPNNWAAVCNAGIVGAALYLETDLARLAEIIARSFRSLDDYLSGFDVNGGTTEGPFCWSYGFGYYTILAHLIAHRTAGVVDILAFPQVREIAQFPLRSALTPYAYANFSDCNEDFTHIPAHLAYLSRHLDLPDLMRLARVQPPNFREQTLTWGLRALFWRPGAQSEGAFVPGPHDWFNGMMWMIARQNPADPEALVLAAKGGHNGEMHNHNDAGSFIIHFRQESLIAELGRGRFTKKYFGQGRYDYLVNASKGHSVPVPNGQPQLPGRDHRAELLEHRAGETGDTLALELAALYPPEADLRTLRRRLTLHRQPSPGRVELEDRVEFGTASGQLDTVLITLHEVTQEPGRVVIRGKQGAVAVDFDPDTVTAHVELHPDVPLHSGPVDVQRLIFSLKEPVQKGRIHLEITPLD